MRRSCKFTKKATVRHEIRKELRKYNVNVAIQLDTKYVQAEDN